MSRTLTSLSRIDRRRLRLPIRQWILPKAQRRVEAIGISPKSRMPPGTATREPPKPAGRRTGREAEFGGGIESLRRGLSVKCSIVPHQAEKLGSRRRPFTTEEILQWADAHRKSTGRWPTVNSGPVLDAPGENWSAISGALTAGCRGLPRGSSLARLLAEQRSARNHMALPALTHKQIVAWADAHHLATGRWPSCESGAIRGAPGETWATLGGALKRGGRGLPGGESLAELLSRTRGLRPRNRLLPLSIPQILRWADMHFRRFRKWPSMESGRVVNASHEIWCNIDAALRGGFRGLPGGSSLATLLVEQRGIRARRHLPPFSISRILIWADRHFERTGDWPRRDSGTVVDADGETWQGISDALQRGDRGLPGGSSLATLLEVKRGRPHAGHRPPLTVQQILRWADHHHDRTGRWPNATSGKVLADETETWGAINVALVTGLRGLRAGSSLPNLLGKRRGYQHAFNGTPLSVSQVLSWADAHKRRTGKWPTKSAGLIPGTKNDSWKKIDAALANGQRGLAGGSSLAKLLAERRDHRNIAALPRLTVVQILSWVDRHKQRTGSWPQKSSGAIADAPGETWAAIQAALRAGRRGLPEGLTIAHLLAQYRGLKHPDLRSKLSVPKLVAWAQAHRERAGVWPTLHSGAIIEASGETWRKVDAALRNGLRGLAGDSSLSRLLAERCGAPYRKCRPSQGRSRAAT